MDRSSYREPTARGSPAGSIISTSSQGTKRRRTTYNTPIPIEYRNQFLRTPDTAFSPPASQNGKSEQPLFGSSTNRTLFNSPSRNPTSTTTTAFPQIPSRQSPIALQTSPPLSSSFRGPTRRPVRPVNPHNRSNLSSIGPRRGGSIAGSINGNSVRPSPSLGMAASSVSRAPGSTRSSVASGSLRGSASNYTASSYSRPLPSAEDLKKRADPLIGFLGQSIQRAKGALTESKEAEKEAQRIKEREEIRKSKEEEERRRRDEIFQQIMEEEAERERQEMLEQARALRHTQRTEAAEGEVQTYTPVDSQPAVQTSQGMGVLQSAKEEGPQEQATSMGQPVLSSAASIQTPSIIAKSTAPEIPASESSEESEESGAEDTPICREEARYNAQRSFDLLIELF
ncbi:hypothetical protein BJ508DRAFT_97829 [Ascobolus immersus RN42]|uniref:Pinin/SDK/MemA protein domain-containing protein n=1 Tax=Ascobolus immersus RN42 TaxID=1160509 RepID=A0A3N4IMC0_ASCIM|nr:hypothetical protein BJ508DRAFT_97829 [Ascobolus immersus RN42]